METYAESKALVEDPDFARERQKALVDLAEVDIDAPLLKVIEACSQILYCFTQQSCWGHFVYPGQDNPHSIDPLPRACDLKKVEYRIAYIAFCIESSDDGRRFRESLVSLVAVSPEYIQFLSADWFWNQRVNTYQLQVEPERFKHVDRCVVPYGEALLLEQHKSEFFRRLENIISNGW